MDRCVITVDGLAGSGKSTLAQLLSEKLVFVHFNSGLLYRAVGYLALQNGIKPNDESGVLNLLKQTSIEMNEVEAVQIKDQRITAEELHQTRISEAASLASGFASVRACLNNLQRNVFKGSGLVAEGRDMGTVIFPEALVKFFIEASVEVRVARRLAQLKVNEQDEAKLKREIEIEIIERDERDKNRAVAPTVAAEGAVIIDNSSLPLTKVVQYMYDIVAKKVLTA